MSLSPKMKKRLKRLPAGTIIDERYEVISFIASGGMGDVYVVRHILMGRVVALKVLSLPTVEGGIYEERFRREARIASKLDHPNIVRTYDFGFFQALPYIVMQLLVGHDLSVELKNKETMFTPRGLHLFGEAISAVGSAHARGVVHKDLKPSNLYIDQIGRPEERLIILDFGVARGNDARIARLTTTGTIAGTPEYLAPEYITNQTISPMVDVYSLGLILCEMISGVRVVRGETLYDKLVFHMSGHITVPKSICGTQMEYVILRATEREPLKRYPDARAMLIEYNVALEKLFDQSKDSNLSDRPVWLSPLSSSKENNLHSEKINTEIEELLFERTQDLPSIPSEKIRSQKKQDQNTPNITPWDSSLENLSEKQEQLEQNLNTPNNITPWDSSLENLSDEDLLEEQELKSESSSQDAEKLDELLFISSFLTNLSETENKNAQEVKSTELDRFFDNEIENVSQSQQIQYEEFQEDSLFPNLFNTNAVSAVPESVHERKSLTEFQRESTALYPNSTLFPDVLGENLEKMLSLVCKKHEATCGFIADEQALPFVIIGDASSALQTMIAALPFIEETKKLLHDSENNSEGNISLSLKDGKTFHIVWLTEISHWKLGLITPKPIDKNASKKIIDGFRSILNEEEEWR